MKTQSSLHKIILMALTVMLFGQATACSVRSSELASTAAADIKFYATVSEYSTDDTAEVTAYVTPLNSSSRIELDQGETIAIVSDTESGTSSPAFLSETNLFSIFSLNGFYEAELSFAREGGNYTITYTDADDNATKVNIPRSNNVPILNLSEGDVLSQDTLTLNWDPELVEGTLKFQVEYYDSIQEKNVSSSETIPNTGTHTVDSSTYSGDVTVSLIHHIDVNVDSNFGSTNLDMRHISRVEVFFE